MGAPQKSRMFLFGIRFDPPRAGTIANLSGTYSLSHGAFYIGRQSYTNTVVTYRLN